MTNIPDQIVKEVVLAAPVARVWRAVSDAREFGTWFGVEFEGPFVVGEQVSGRIVPTKVDPEVAKMQEEMTGVPFETWIEKLVPEKELVFRWHPYAVDPGVDYANAPTTTVRFELKAVDGGTRLIITESGFDKIPLERRADAFTSNEGGWDHQTRLIAKYLELYER